nr:Arc family DNA-binding protein [Brucella anthropi]
MVKVYTSLRLPIDVKAFIEQQALENSSSQNSEIVRAIRAAMKEKGAAEIAVSAAPIPIKSTEGLTDEYTGS